MGYELLSKGNFSLTELGYLVEDYERGFFDVIHLSGHATRKDGTPCFITESEFGEKVYSSAEEIAKVLPFNLPRLLFLSGCRTGYSWDGGTLPTMAHQLLQHGETAVLSWGDRVLDGDATEAAATFYQVLATGKTVPEALTLTYCTMVQQQARDWHLLRLYVAGSLPGALVKQGRRPPLRRSVVPQQFVDPEGEKLRVATRESFVGRRRQLQNCLRVLKSDFDRVGVLIHGMGGLGKSTIAARLCDRLSQHEKIVWWRQIDERDLVEKLGDRLDNQEQRRALKDSSEALKYRLRKMLAQLNDFGAQPLLLVLDDFEWNLEPREGRYVLKAGVADILSDLVWAIGETGCNHRLIITCRYKFQSELLNAFYAQGLEGFYKSDLQKKLRHLEYFSSARTDNDLKERALQLADGNPRLLEFLDNKILGKEDAASRLSKLKASSEQWQEKIVWPELYKQVDANLERVLSRCLVFELPVPMAALEAVCVSVPDYQQQLRRAIELALIEVSSEVEESQRLYRVSRILPRIISRVQLPQEPEQYTLRGSAAKALYPLWGTKENKSMERWRELFRLAFGDKENPQRFREGFLQMLAVQEHKESDRAYAAELRQVAGELPCETLCTQLEEYLKREQWRKADEETAFIFYQMRIKTDSRTLYEFFCKALPSKLLKEIDQMWVEASQGRFGFSVQKQIWESVRPPAVLYTDYDSLWENFGEQVGWYKGHWKKYNTLPFSLTSPGSLPCRYATQMEDMTKAEGWDERCGGGVEGLVWFGVTPMAHRIVSYLLTNIIL